MKRKSFIAVAAIVLIAVIALVVLMLEKNNSEFRIQNSELIFRENEEVAE